MCFSFKTSVYSYSIALLASVFAFATRQVVLGCLIFAYAQIQLSEAFIWRGLDTDNEKMNKLGTNLCKYFLATHIFAIGVGIILSILLVSKRKLKITDFIPVIIGIVFFIFVVFYYNSKEYPDMTYPKNGICTNNCNDSKNRLKWTFPYTWYILSFLIIFLCFFCWLKPLKAGMIIYLCFVFTLIMSFIIYPKTVGSIWCWIASFLAPLVVLIGYFIIRNTPSDSILI
jgi:hypothetical protein